MSQLHLIFHEHANHSQAFTECLAIHDCLQLLGNMVFGECCVTKLNQLLGFGMYIIRTRYGARFVPFCQVYCVMSCSVTAILQQHSQLH